MIRIRTSTIFLSCALVLSSTYFASAASENFRVKRPSANTQLVPPKAIPTDSAQINSEQVSSEQVSSEQPKTAPDNRSNDNSHVMSGSVQTNELLNQPLPQEDRETIIRNRSLLAVERWRAVELEQERELMAQHGSGDSHHGFMHHLTSTVGSVGGTAALIAVSYGAGGRMPIGQVRHGAPGITIEPGHCPAAFDPAFQAPYSWWQDLSSEQAGNPYLADPWQAWLASVREVLATHNKELKSTGTACVHVIVNPDGSINNMTPYNGEGGGIQNSGSMMSTLYKIVSEVRNFPPFPINSRVRAYHLILKAQN